MLPWPWLLAGLAIAGGAFLLGWQAAPLEGARTPGRLLAHLEEYDLEEMEALLNGGLVEVDRLHYRRGYPRVSEGLADGTLTYRVDLEERLLSVAGIWAHGGGDCEDLAAALVAEELEDAGAPWRRGPRAVIEATGPESGHVRTRRRNGTLVDPSETGGMYRVLAEHRRGLQGPLWSAPGRAA